MGDLKAKMFNRKAMSSKSKPELVISSLNLKERHNIADIGIGGGYFSLQFSKLAGKNGRVYSIDTDPGLLENIEQECDSKNIDNIVTVQAKGEHFPEIVKDVDLVFARNVYHHLPDRVNFFKSLIPSLKSDGRIAIIEYNGKGSLSFHKLFGHYVPEETLQKEMKDAGYRLLEEYDFLPEQSFMIFGL